MTEGCIMAMDDAGIVVAATDDGTCCIYMEDCMLCADEVTTLDTDVIEVDVMVVGADDDVMDDVIVVIVDVPVFGIDDVMGAYPLYWKLWGRAAYW